MGREGNMWRETFSAKKSACYLALYFFFPAVSCSGPEIYFPLCLEGALHAFVCYGKQYIAYSRLLFHK